MRINPKITKNCGQGLFIGLLQHGNTLIYNTTISSPHQSHEIQVFMLKWKWISRSQTVDGFCFPRKISTHIPMKEVPTFAGAWKYALITFNNTIWNANKVKQMSWQGLNNARTIWEKALKNSKREIISNDFLVGIFNTTRDGKDNLLHHRSKCKSLWNNRTPNGSWIGHAQVVHPWGFVSWFIKRIQ